MAARLRELLAAHERSRDLVSIGAYESGARTRSAWTTRWSICRRSSGFLRQSPQESGSLAETVALMSDAVGSVIVEHAMVEQEARRCPPSA